MCSLSLDEKTRAIGEIPVSEVKLVKIPSIDNNKVKILIALKLVMLLVITLGQRLGGSGENSSFNDEIGEKFLSKWCGQVKIPEQ